MSPITRLRQRISTVLHMVMAFSVIILLVQLWLFTVVLENLENSEASRVSIAAIAISIIGSGVIWILIRLFTQMEKDH